MEPATKGICVNATQGTTSEPVALSDNTGTGRNYLAGTDLLPLSISPSLTTKAVSVPSVEPLHQATIYTSTTIINAARPISVPVADASGGSSAIDATTASGYSQTIQSVSSEQPDTSVSTATRRTSTRPVLLLDVDGVLYDLVGWVLSTLVNPQLGTSYTPESVTDWRWAELPQEARSIFFSALDHPECWSQGSPYPEAVTDCQRLAGSYTLVMVTAMRQRYTALRERWLQEHGFPCQRLIVTADKLKAAREIKAVAAVEDYALTATKLGKANIPTWLVARPWNQFAPIDTERNIRRGTWTEGVAWLERYAGRLVAR